MKKIRVCIVGCGNITRTRHVPALKKNDIEIIGAISVDQKNLDLIIKKHTIKNSILLSDPQNEEILRNTKWFMEDADAVICGLPPMEHFVMAMMFLKLNKHVLMEKPFTMSEVEAVKLHEEAKKRNLIINVIHNFQYADSMLRLEELIKNNSLGEVKSVLEIQLSNRERRLPKWYNNLPLGLFYDEAAHFFYSIQKLFGKIHIDNAFCRYNDDCNDKTPRILNANIKAGDIPVTLYVNFNAPVCEWGLIILASKKIAIYDFFKDILVIAENDGQHYAKNILKTAFQYTKCFLGGFILNGFKLLTGNLLYGQDVVVKKFIQAISTGIEDDNLSAIKGLEVVKAMNQIVEMVNKR